MEENTLYFKEYRIKNREKLNNYKREWVAKNKNNINKYQREYYKHKKLKEMNKKIDVFKLSLNNTNADT